MPIVTDRLMAKISELSGRPYIDEYVPKRVKAEPD